MGVLDLNAATRRQLEEVLAHPCNVRQLKRAQALLWMEEGDTVTCVAERLRVSRQSVYNWTDWIQHRKGQPVAKRLEDALRSGRPPDKAEVVDRVIRQLLSGDPQKEGYRATGWTNPLLRDFLQRQYHLEVSHQTIRQAIFRAGYRWKRPRYVLSRRPATWRQAKGGSNVDSNSANGPSF